jgi:type I restriction enzyme S subunit
VSDLGFLERLLDGASVKWLPLGAVVDVIRGRRLVKSQLEEVGPFAVFQNSMTPLGYYHEANVAAGSAFIICAGAAGSIGYSESEFWAADDVYVFVPPDGIMGRYIYHWLLSEQGWISSQVRKGVVPRLPKPVVESLSLPIPCPDDPDKSLAIQGEIVRILDTFTELTAELTAELAGRKKQYNHYRDQLYCFENTDVEWKILGDVNRPGIVGGSNS